MPSLSKSPLSRLAVAVASLLRSDSHARASSASVRPASRGSSKTLKSPASPALRPRQPTPLYLRIPPRIMVERGKFPRRLWAFLHLRLQSLLSLLSSLVGNNPGTSLKMNSIWHGLAPSRCRPSPSRSCSNRETLLPLDDE